MDHAGLLQIVWWQTFWNWCFFISYLHKEWITVGLNIYVLINDFFLTCGGPNYWFERYGSSHRSMIHSLFIYLHHSNLKCWSFHKHFINFVHIYEGLCFAFVVVQRCWNRLLLSTSASSGLLCKPPWDVREPLRSGCTPLCFQWHDLSPDSSWKYNIELLEAGRATVESVHLLFTAVLVKITVQFWFFRTSCQLEKKNKNKNKSHSWPWILLCLDLTWFPEALAPQSRKLWYSSNVYLLLILYGKYLLFWI